MHIPHTSVTAKLHHSHCDRTSWLSAQREKRTEAEQRLPSNCIKEVCCEKDTRTISVRRGTHGRTSLKSGLMTTAQTNGCETSL